MRDGRVKAKRLGGVVVEALFVADKRKTGRSEM